MFVQQHFKYKTDDICLWYTFDSENDILIL